MSIASLFQSLKSDVDLHDLLPEQKEELLANIKLLDEKGSELFFVLIKLFDIETSLGSCSTSKYKKNTFDF